MTEVCRDFVFVKSFDPVSTEGRVSAGGVQFEDLRGFELLDCFDQADIKRFCIGVLPDLLLRVFPLGKSFSELIGTAAEHDDLIAGEQVGDVTFHKAVHGNKFRNPAVGIDDPGIPFLILPSDIRTDRGREMDDGIPAAGEFFPDH
jgi:hypothetical protein